MEAIQGSNDHVWWKMTRSLSGLSKSPRRATPDVNALGNFFASKLSLSDDFDAGLSVLPQELYDVKFKSSWRVQISKVRSIMKDLDVDKAVGPTALVLGYYMIVTWSFLTLSLCYSAVYVDLVPFQYYGKLLELRLCLKIRVLFLIPHFIVQYQLCLLWHCYLSVLLVPRCITLLHHLYLKISMNL